MSTGKKKEDYRQPTTRHLHKKRSTLQGTELTLRDCVGLKQSLRESYMYVGIGTQPKKRTGLSKMAGVLTSKYI